MFTELGFAVEEIPTSNVHREERADLLVSKGNEIYVVEAKSKLPHAEYSRLESNVARGGFGSISRTVSAQGALSKIIVKAADQLGATHRDGVTGKLLWLSALHGDWNFVFSMFMQRFLGSVELSLVRSASDLTQQSQIKTCHYYVEPDFRKYPGIDAVIFSGREGSHLLVNEFGLNVALLREHALYRDAMASGSCTDPPTLRAADDAIAILEPASRLSARTRWQYIRDCYGLFSSTAQDVEFTGRLQISRTTNINA